jgi:hypothetical protein
MDISARAISLPDRPQWAIWVTSVRIRREDRSSISFSSSRRPRQVRCFDERQKLPPPRGVKATPPSRPIASDPRLLDRARRDHADRHDLIMRGVGGVAPVDQGARRLGRALRENSTLRTVLIAPSLRLAHSPLEDGRKRPDERSTQPTYFYACSPSSIAASTFGGDIGSSVSRRPVVRSIALAMAAIGGQILTSAAPLAP